MKKAGTLVSFGIAGALSWSLTIFLRDTFLDTLFPVHFILGILPNFSAACFFIWMGELFTENILHKDFTFKIAVIICIIICLLALGSEIVHDIYLNSPFDIFDIAMTFLASGMILIYSRKR